MTDFHGLMRLRGVLWRKDLGHRHMQRPIRQRRVQPGNRLVPLGLRQI